MWIVHTRWIKHLIHAFSHALFYAFSESFEIFLLSVMLAINHVWKNYLLCNIIIMLSQSLCRCFKCEANYHTYKMDASWFIGIIFVSGLINIFVIYCSNCHILLFLLHSGNPHEVHNSPFSGFINGWKTLVSNTTFCNI